jgi:16S rRNA (cytidine1402-2'-O)-methyltransferase
MLYVVPTPIGNLQDITLRALDVLKSVKTIFAEDTRTTGNLLKHYSIQTPLRSFHAHNEHQTLSGIIELLQNGTEVALVSDAGTPGISDPGFLLIRACHQHHIPVTCLPGPTAFVPALVASGLPCDKFYFEGFLPHKKGRQTRVEYLSELPVTFVLYESPHRLIKTLEILQQFCGEYRLACVAREISKLYEEFRTDTLSSLIAHYSEKEKVRGEIVLVIGGKTV